MSNAAGNSVTLESATHHHMPDGGDYLPEIDGATLRAALIAIRDAGRANWGSLGGMTVGLAGGDILHIGNQDAYGGGELMDSQRITRRSYNPVTGLETVIRTYSW